MIYRTTLPRFGDSYTLIGSWIIDDEASGMGIRGDNTLITKDASRFVPHYYCRLIILVILLGVNGAVMTILDFSAIEGGSAHHVCCVFNPAKAPLNNSNLFLSDGALCEAVSREGAGWDSVFSPALASSN